MASKGIGVMAIVLGLVACGGGGESATHPSQPVLSAPSWLNTGGRIMPLGDSITEGYQSRYGGYRFELYRRFMDQNIPVNFVGSLSNTSEGLPDPDHAGHGGWTSYHLRDGNPDYPTGGEVGRWLATAQPQVILLLAGTNDVFYSSDEPLITTNILGLVDKIRQQAPDAELFVGSTPPLRDYDLNQRILRINQSVQQGLTTRMASDSQLHFVDINRAVALSDLDNDGVHIRGNGPGNAKLAEAWLTAMRPVLLRLSGQ